MIFYQPIYRRHEISTYKCLPNLIMRASFSSYYLREKLWLPTRVPNLSSKRLPCIFVGNQETILWHKEHWYDLNTVWHCLKEPIYVSPTTRYWRVGLQRGIYYIRLNTKRSIVYKTMSWVLYAQPKGTRAQSFRLETT